MKVTLTTKDDKLHDFIDIIQDCIAKRRVAKSMEDEAAEIKATADGIIQLVIAETGIDSFESDAGVYKLVKRNPPIFKKDICKDYLLKAGVDSDIVVKAFEDATEKKPPTSSMGFYPPKAKKGAAA